jgi:hypothetical protein
MILKKTTKNSKIASIHTGDLKNITKLYRVILTLAGDYGWVFAKPIQVKDDLIEWESQFNSLAISYSEADEATKKEITSILKEVIYSILYGKIKEQFKILKDAFEIPDESSIFYQEGKVVLAPWGHIKSKFDAKREIIFKLIGEEGARLKIKLHRDFLPEDSAFVDISFKDKNFRLKTDINGIVEVFLPTKVKINISIPKEYQKTLILKKGLNTLEIDLSNYPQNLTSQETLEEVLEESLSHKPFLIEIWDCQNSIKLQKSGKLKVISKNKEKSFEIKNGEVTLEEFFEEEILIDTIINGYILKEQISITPKSSGKFKLCLEPMVKLQKEGAIGDPRFNITWPPTPQDIDIMVVTPCNELIYFGEREKICKGFSGKLDIDIRERECKKRKKDCQENITFDNGGPRGEYIVIVKKYAGTNEKTPITLTIINNGKEEVKHFTLKKVGEEKRFLVIH